MTASNAGSYLDSEFRVCHCVLIGPSAGQTSELHEAAVPWVSQARGKLHESTLQRPMPAVGLLLSVLCSRARDHLPPFQDSSMCPAPQQRIAKTDVGVCHPSS